MATRHLLGGTVVWLSISSSSVLPVSRKRFTSTSCPILTPLSWEVWEKRIPAKCRYERELSYENLSIGRLEVES